MNFFFKIAKGGTLHIERVLIDIAPWKCLFHFTCEAFMAKNQNFFWIWKNRKYDEENKRNNF